MLKSGIESAPEANQALLYEFNIQEGVKMQSQLHGQDDFLGFDLSNERDLSAIAKRVYEVFAKPSCSPLKHHLFIAHIPEELFKSLRELCMGDKNGEFTQERLFQREWPRYLFRELSAS